MLRCNNCGNRIRKGRKKCPCCGVFIHTGKKVDRYRHIGYLSPRKRYDKKFRKRNRIQVH